MLVACLFFSLLLFRQGVHHVVGKVLAGQICEPALMGTLGAGSAPSSVDCQKLLVVLTQVMQHRRHLQPPDTAQ